MQVAYLLYDRFTALDVTGPHEVLNSVPDVESIFVAESAGPIRNESDTLSLVADASLDEVPDPGVIVVPGGYGTRALLQHDPVLDWIRTAHQTSEYTASVCTGTLLLAAAGLLDGKPATTHFLARELLGELGADPVSDRVVEEGKILTAAGVSSGIDMALRLVQLKYGDEVAQAVQLGIEYDPQPCVDAGSPEKAPKEIVDLVTTVFLAQEAEATKAAEAGKQPAV
jgi:transcriptional regulator GlxA family with amidase domain